MTQATRRLVPHLAVLALVAVGGAPAAKAQDKAADIYAAAGKAFHEGRKCVRASREEGANFFVENEKAIGHLEQSQRLMEKYLLLEPDDSEAERMMVEVLALLFFCHKMSPMVDPEEIDDPEPAADAEEPDPGPDEAAEEQARKAEAAAAKAKAAEEAKANAGAEATALLEKARAYVQEHADDGMGALAKFFFVAERFPETEAGQAARTEAETLQASLFAVKVAVPKKVARKPLTDADRKAIEKQLKTWLGNRMKVRCASCGGEGFSECKKCGGTGKLRGRAGRKSTCKAKKGGEQCRRGKIACGRGSCSGGIDTRILEKVVVKARAPYYTEKLKSLLGGSSKALDNFLVALAATLGGSARAPAEISRCATELGIAPVQLRDVIEAHGPDASLVANFKSFSVDEVGRKTKYSIKGKDSADEVVTFEQTPDGKWWLRSFK